MQAFWEHLQHAITTHRIKVKSIRLLRWIEISEVRHNQPSRTDTTLMLIYIVGTKPPYVTELYIANQAPYVTELYIANRLLM